MFLFTAKKYMIVCFFINDFEFVKNLCELKDFRFVNGFFIIFVLQVQKHIPFYGLSYDYAQDKDVVRLTNSVFKNTFCHKISYSFKFHNNFFAEIYTFIPEL